VRKLHEKIAIVIAGCQKTSIFILLLVDFLLAVCELWNVVIVKAANHTDSLASSSLLISRATHQLSHLDMSPPLFVRTDRFLTPELRLVSK